MMESNSVNVGLVGLGFGAEFIPIYQKHSNANVYAICRRNEEELNKIGDSFGIENFYGKNGGIHARYIATGADDADKYLTANIQYFANVASGDTFVVYLPENPISGDSVSIIDVGGNLTYNTSLIIRAQGTGTRVQGDSSGTTLGLVGSTPYASGEMIVQTPHAGLTLIYLSGVDSLGNAVGGGFTGWWLKEV